MKCMTRTILAIAVLLVVSGAVFAADMVDNPTYQNWAKYKAGTFVKYKQNAEVMGNKTESEIVTTLLEVTPEKVVVETSGTMLVAGNKMDMPKTKMDFAAKMEKVATDPAKTPKIDSKQGEEEITVPAGKIKCKSISAMVKQGESEIQTKTWTSDDVPGSLVKSETSMEKPVKSVTLMELVEKNIK
ncbi:MAG: hypothetical protein WA705_10775 [Candidatus Ozemobacteraceae bacterium]